MGSALSICVADGAADEKNELGTADKWKVVGQSGATVRATIELDSPVVSNLEKDTIIYVAEVRGRRARLVSPVQGWASTKTEQGYEILQMQPKPVKLKIVVRQGASLAVGPEDAAAVIGKIPYGAVVEATGAKANINGLDRIHVKHGKNEGWISVKIPSSSDNPTETLVVQQTD